MILTEGEKSLTSLYEKQENNALESNQLKNKKEMLGVKIYTLSICFLSS